MAYRFKELIVSLVPSGGLGPLLAGDGGGTAGGGCTTSCGKIEIECGDSGEVMHFEPYSSIDPAYQLELRQLLVYGLTASAVPVPEPARLEALDEQMRPQTLEEAELLEQQLAGALREVQEHVENLKRDC